MPLPAAASFQRQNFHCRFFRLAIVNILSNLLVPLAGLVNVAFLGHLSEIHHLAGVALATVLFNYIYWTFGFLRMGTTGTTAQALGRGDQDAVLVTGLRNSVLALGVGLTILLLQHPLRELGFTLLSAAPEVKASGYAYYNAMIWGAPATLLNYVFIGWFLGQEQGYRVLVLSAVGNGATVALDYLFIVQWGWESAGAGWATASSQYLMVLVGLILCRDVRSQQVQAVAKALLDPSALKATLVLNGDILVRTLALISTFALFTNLSSLLGTVVLATNTILLQVVTLAAYFIDGLAFATESFAGSLQGRGSGLQLAPLVRISGSTSLSLGITFALMFALWPDSLFQLLTSHAEVLNQIRRYVWWLLPVLSFGSVAYMLDGYFLGLIEGRTLRWATVTAALVGFAPISLVAWQLHSSQLLWLALSLFMAVRAVALGIQVPRTLRNK